MLTRKQLQVMVLPMLATVAMGTTGAPNAMAQTFVQKNAMAAKPALSPQGAGTIVELSLPMGKYPKYQTAGQLIAGDFVNVWSNDKDIPTFLYQISTGTSSVYPTGFSGADPNASGIVAGVSSVTNDASVLQNGVVKPLGFLPGASSSYSNAINALGTIVGVSGNSTTRTNTPFIYSNGRLSVVPGFTGAGAPSSSEAMSINNEGDIVGQATTSTQTCSWFESGVYNSVSGPTYFACASFESAAYSVNNNKQVVGYITLDPNGVLTHAYYWENGTFTDLGALNPSGPNYGSVATGINDQGQIIGEIETAQGQYPFLYDLNHPELGFQNLNSFLPPGSGWIMSDVASITNAGQISGVGIPPNPYCIDGGQLCEDEGFLFTLPPQ